MTLNKFLEMLRSFATSFHKLILSALRILRMYLTVTSSKNTRKKRNDTRIRNSIYGW